MASLDPSGGEAVGFDYSEQLANLPRRILGDYSHTAFKLGCKVVSDMASDDIYKAVHESIMGRYQGMRIASEDVNGYYTKPLYAYHEERQKEMDHIRRATKVGTASVAYTLLRSPTVQKIVSSMPKFEIAQYSASGMAIARDQDKSAKMGEQLRRRSKEMGAVYNFVATKAEKPKEMVKIFGNELGADLAYGAQIYKESARGLLLTFAGATKVIDIKRAKYKLEEEAYMDRALIAYERVAAKFRKPDFDARQAFDQYPVFLGLYELITSDFDDFLNDLYDYAEMPEIRNGFKEACFVGLCMLRYDRSLNQAISNSDSRLLYAKAKEACSSAFFMVTELDGGEGQKRLVKDFPLTFNLINAIGAGLVSEVGYNNPYAYENDRDIGLNLADLSYEEVEQLAHLPGFTRRDAMERAGLTLCEALRAYVREIEARQILKAQEI